MERRLKALSVWNPWAWALVTRRPNGRPLKPGENRVTPLWSTMAGQWTLIQVGLHKPDPVQVAAVKAIAESEGVEMPTWAAYASKAVKDGKKIGAIVGAVLFTADRDPDDVTGPYNPQWVSEGATHWWEVAECVSFGRHIPCKGQQAPLFFDVPDDVHMLAQADLRAALKRIGWQG